MKESTILMDPSQAAALLNVSEKTLWNHTAPRGKCMPVVRLGKKVLYSRAALEAWIAAQTNPQSTAPLETSGG